MKLHALPEFATVRHEDVRNEITGGRSIWFYCYICAVISYTRTIHANWIASRKAIRIHKYYGIQVSAVHCVVWTQFHCRLLTAQQLYSRNAVRLLCRAASALIVVASVVVEAALCQAFVKGQVRWKVTIANAVDHVAASPVKLSRRPRSRPRRRWRPPRFQQLRQCTMLVPACAHLERLSPPCHWLSLHTNRTGLYISPRHNSIIIMQINTVLLHDCFVDGVAGHSS